VRGDMRGGLGPTAPQVGGAAPRGTGAQVKGRRKSAWRGIPIPERFGGFARTGWRARRRDGAGNQ